MSTICPRRAGDQVPFGALSSPIGPGHASHRTSRVAGSMVAGGGPHPYVAPQSGGAEASCDDDLRQVGARAWSSWRRRSRWLALRRAARNGVDRRRASLRPTARSTSSSSRRRAAIPRGLRARAHSLRFLRQCLRGLRPAVPPGVGTRQRRGQGHAQRPAFDHLGRRRGQERSSSSRRTISTRR